MARACSSVSNMRSTVYEPPASDCQASVTRRVLPRHSRSTTSPPVSADSASARSRRTLMSNTAALCSPAARYTSYFTRTSSSSPCRSNRESAATHSTLSPGWSTRPLLTARRMSPQPPLTSMQPASSRSDSSETFSIDHSSTHSELTASERNARKRSPPLTASNCSARMYPPSSAR